MSIVSSTIEAALTGFSLANVRELASKAVHALLDLVASKAETEGSALLVAEAAKHGITVPPEVAAKLVHAIVSHARSHA